MKKLLVVLVAATVMAACAPQQALVKQTASGYPEGLFENTDIESVRSKLIEGCSSRGIFVQEATANQVVCGKTMEGGDAILAQMLVGNSYSTTPEQKVRFVIYQSGPNVKVTAQQWVESQMAFGQMRRQELTGNNQKNDLQRFLFSLGAK